MASLKSLLRAFGKRSSYLVSGTNQRVETTTTGGTITAPFDGWCILFGRQDVENPLPSYFGLYSDEVWGNCESWISPYENYAEHIVVPVRSGQTLTVTQGGLSEPIQVYWVRSICAT